MLVALVVALVVRVGARRNRRWSSYNSIFYFVAFAEVFAGCGGPLPSLPPPPSFPLLLEALFLLESAV